MSKRERNLALAIAGLVLLFGMDYFVLTPVMAWFSDTSSRIVAAQEQLRTATMLVDNEQIIQERWQTYETAGLSGGESALRINLQQGLATWAQQARFNLTTLNSGRTVKGDVFNRVEFIASGTGSLASAVGFIERVHASEFPLRIESIRVTSRSENDDSLTLQMTVSTINEAAAPGSVAMRTGASR